jgi:hypothetical protein
MKKTILPMRVHIPGIIATARNNQWSAKQLAQSFNEMSLEVAQKLLNQEIDLDENGNEVPHEH